MLNVIAGTIIVVEVIFATCVIINEIPLEYLYLKRKNGERKKNSE